MIDLPPRVVWIERAICVEFLESCRAGCVLIHSFTLQNNATCHILQMGKLRLLLDDMHGAGAAT